MLGAYFKFPKKEIISAPERLHFASPRLVSLRLVSPHLVSSRLVSSHLVSPRLVSPCFASPRHASPHLVSFCLVSLRRTPRHATPRLATLYTILRLTLYTLRLTPYAIRLTPYALHYMPYVIRHTSSQFPSIWWTVGLDRVIAGPAHQKPLHTTCRVQHVSQNGPYPGPQVSPSPSIYSRHPQPQVPLPRKRGAEAKGFRSEEHTSELQSLV